MCAKTGEKFPANGTAYFIEQNGDSAKQQSGTNNNIPIISVKTRTGKPLSSWVDRSICFFTVTICFSAQGESALRLYYKLCNNFIMYNTAQPFMLLSSTLAQSM